MLQTVSILLQIDENLYLSRRRLNSSYPFYWQTAGGKVDPGETLTQAATRELFEETGLTITENRLIPEGETDSHTSPHIGAYEVTTFCVILNENEIPKVTEIEKSGEWKKVPFKKAFNLARILPSLVTPLHKRLNTPPAPKLTDNPSVVFQEA